MVKKKSKPNNFKSLLILALAINLFSANIVQAWYDNAWSSRIKVTVDSAKVTADQTNFPVMVDLSDLPVG
ncbi:MAG: hypothetical protein HOA17_09295, partial [Candidatus Melainabacteria bacterium]|nr:hypothetical protein [Candidatus Melainabacteria bacterium]